MFARLLLIFTVVPLVELYLLVKIGTVIGPLQTIAIVIFTALVGAYLVRLQGIMTLYRIQRDFRQGIFPGNALFDGFLILLAGAFLITPGLVTDLVGLLLLIPGFRTPVKAWIKRRVLDYFRRNMRR